jgi:hypothetical protein
MKPIAAKIGAKGKRFSASSMPITNAKIEIQTVTFFGGLILINNYLPV